MSSVMWILFLALLALLVLSLLWLIWKLRNFSQSQNQTVLDDRLLQAMLGDEVLSKKVKKALVKKSGRIADTDEEDDGQEQPQKSD
ncbi:MAG: hypothetical protein CDV28_12920 [Candidatus Electronema aureum]|uniref:Uncharacterized protein n=1 Tax=Candidatus Electronema aureum TaxID=2005002 RepID=A0A521G035_9BACT|nr:MAG: hypothetical protein CDV28_12920 [Candidatus Electronema aureum]